MRPSVFAALLLFPFAAHGTIVTTVTDEDNGSLGGGTGISLREAVKYSPTGDTVTFAPALSGQTIRLILGELLIARSLTIDGSALPDHVTLSGDKTGDGKTADDSRVIQITIGTVVLDSLIITGGNCPDSPTNEGAGICVDNTPGTFTIVIKLTVRNCTFSGNHAGSGAGIYFFRPLPSSDSFLQIENSTFTGNTVTGGGAAVAAVGKLMILDSIFIGNSARNGGAILMGGGAFTLKNSTLSGNSAYEGGGVFTDSSSIQDTVTLQDSSITGNAATAGGGVFARQGNVTVENSRISDNSAGADGGGIYDQFSNLTVRNCELSRNSAQYTGGGLYRQGGTLTVENSTVSSNFAKASGGGIESSGPGSFNLANVTVCGNTANSFGGGGIVGTGTLVLNNTIVAGNFAPMAPSAPDIVGSYTGSNNLVSTTPLLAPLDDYGGPTQTMPPLPGSPAIDTGGTTTLTTDQRGFPRVFIPDIGAAEYQGASDLTRFWPLDFDGDASPYGTEQALGTDPLISDPANSRNITAPVLNASGHPVLSFGIGAAAPGTRWILRRSTDLLTFTEIYRYSGSTDTAAPGVTFLRTATGVTVTDTNPPPGGVFYRFEAVLEP